MDEFLLKIHMAKQESQTDAGKERLKKLNQYIKDKQAGEQLKALMLITDS